MKNIFKTLAAYLPKNKPPKNIKVIAAVFGSLQVASTAAGAYIGATAAASTAGAIGLGALGFVAGNLAGGIAGGVAFLAAIVYNARKAKKSSAQKAPGPSKPDLAIDTKLTRLHLKNGFENAHKNVAPKTVAPVKKHALHFGR